DNSDPPSSIDNTHINNKHEDDDIMNNNIDFEDVTDWPWNSLKCFDYLFHKLKLPKEIADSIRECDIDGEILLTIPETDWKEQLINYYKHANQPYQPFQLI